MGCSPSKGTLFSKLEALGPHKAVALEEQQAGLNSIREDVDDTSWKTEKKEDKLLTEENDTEMTALCHLDTNTAVSQNIDGTRETEGDLMPEELNTDLMERDQIKMTGTELKKKSKKRSSVKQIKTSFAQTKTDCLPHIKRAHQAAYSFLNPNISRYETLLGLLDHAAQAQMSLQPMMCALVSCFEELNQALEEMADEGELMLKEHADYMALPSGMTDPSVREPKPTSDTANSLDPSSDLQKLLQHAAEKMKLHGASLQALGDKTLEEAVVYFASISKQIDDKLRVKQKTERRLAQVVSQIERTARGANPEDSALYSEDSGIGVESESLTGSERHCRHRGSAGSGSCGSGVNVRSALDHFSDAVGPNRGAGDDEDEEDYQDEREYEDNENDGSKRKRSSSSPPDPSQALHSLCKNVIHGQHLKGQRPLTASKPEDLSSTNYMNIMTELQENKKDLDQRMKRTAEFQRLKTIPLYKSCGARRHSLNGSGDAHKSQMRKELFYRKSPKRHSVRRLITTFSQGADGRQELSLGKITSHERRHRKSHFQLSDSVKSHEGGLVISDNSNNNRWPDSRDDLDLDNLPPPPPEVLMDNSFQSNESQLGNGSKFQEDSICRLPVINHKTGISQRLKTQIQREVLPNKTTMRLRSVNVSSAHNVHQGTTQNGKLQHETNIGQEGETENSIYQEARKIIHLHNGVESLDGKHVIEPDSLRSSVQSRMGQRCENNEIYEPETSSCSMPVRAPPVSRVRLPPSGPALSHRYPSPPVFRPQYTSKLSSRPSSPKARTSSKENSVDEVIPSVSFQDARSFFCRNEMQNSKAGLTFGSSVLPRQWGEVTRGRTVTRVMESPTRRTQSEQRPSTTSHSEFEVGVSLPSIPAKESK